MNYTAIISVKEEIENKIDDASDKFAENNWGKYCYLESEEASYYLADKENFKKGAHYGLKLGRSQGIRDVIAYIESRWSVKISEDIKNKFAEDIKEQG